MTTKKTRRAAADAANEEHPPQTGAALAEVTATVEQAAPPAPVKAHAVPVRSMPIAPPPVPVWNALVADACPYPADTPLERRACPWERGRFPDGRQMYRCTRCGATRPR